MKPYRPTKPLKPLLLALALAVTSATVEYVALVPVGSVGGPSPAASVIKWAKLEYSSDATTVDDISVAVLDDATAPAELGAWYDLDLSTVTGNDKADGAALTAKVLDDKLYVYLEGASISGFGGGCCADTMVVVDRDTGNAVTWDLDAIVDAAGIETTAAHATHTFDVEQSDGGSTLAYMMVQYVNATLGANADLIVAFDTASGEIVPTADRRLYFPVPYGSLVCCVETLRDSRSYLTASDSARR